MTEFGHALRCQPDLFQAHLNRGTALARRGALDAAIEEMRTAIWLKPDSLDARNNLGAALSQRGLIAEAIVVLREAVRLRPDDPEIHANLGLAHRQREEFDEAIRELRRARDLAREMNPRLVQPIEGELADTEQRARLVPRLAAVIAGRLKPADAAETIGFAQLCHEKQLHGASARLWADAFQAQPKLTDDRQAQYRYNAACTAAMAGCRPGRDDPPLDERAKARWRKQAVAWLEAELATWTKLLEGGPPQVRQPVSEAIQHWKADLDLAGLRDPAELGKLPEDEQKACRALWADVDALLARVQVGRP
jgi:tetratricopeptide (TPR) repeat protein